MFAKTSYKYNVHLLSIEKYSDDEKAGYFLVMISSFVVKNSKGDAQI